MMRGYGAGYGVMDGGWVGGVLLVTFALLVLVGVALLAYWVVRATQRTSADEHRPTGAAEDAVAVARLRFARGEITREQFEEIMAVLGRG